MGLDLAYDEMDEDVVRRGEERGDGEDSLGIEEVWEEEAEGRPRAQRHHQHVHCAQRMVHSEVIAHLSTMPATNGTSSSGLD